MKVRELIRILLEEDMDKSVYIWHNEQFCDIGSYTVYRDECKYLGVTLYPTKKELKENE